MKKFTVLGVAQIIENEGLGYAIQHYMRGKDIADPKLAAMWDECRDLMDEIDRMCQREIEVDE